MLTTFLWDTILEDFEIYKLSTSKRSRFGTTSSVSSPIKTSSPDADAAEQAQKSPFMAARKPLNIAIIGGSCSGLFAGILLKRQGHNVRILESVNSSERQGLAAGVGLSDHVKRFFEENDRLKDISFAVNNHAVEILDANMKVTRKLPFPSLMTTWDAAYYRLRANFDTLKSAYCSSPPPLDRSEGYGSFETGKRVLRIENVAGEVAILVEDSATNNQVRITADVIIAADGANSSIRRQLQPALQRAEPGYVIWRGTVPTKDLSRALLSKIENRTVLYPMKHSYAVM